MNTEANNTYQTTDFTVLSISFEKANAEIRGRFAFFEEYISQFTQQIQNNQIGDAFVVSTCNRTEIYTTTHNYTLVAELYCATVGVSFQDFMKFVHIKTGIEALNHLFRVAAGLESQILGDFEIVSQIKSAYRDFKEHKKYPNAYLERAINSAVQISKRIKNETGLSNGAASVSYAAVHYILKTQKQLSTKNILLLGVGEIGQNTIENLVKHVENPQIKITNRTTEKAEKLAKKYNIPQIDFKKYDKELEQTDILIVATGASRPIIDKENFPKNKPMLIIDMSIPNNVHKNVAENKNVELVDVDFLSTQIEKNIQERKKEIPKAENIIDEMMKDFFDWEKKRKFAPNIRVFKSTLKKMERNELHNIHRKYKYAKIEDMELSNKMVQKITNRFAKYIIDNPAEAEYLSLLMNKIFVVQPQEEFNEKHHH